MRVNAWVSGGFLPESARGRKLEQFVHMADWFSTFCSLAGADPIDRSAEVSGLPEIDSVNAWPLITGASTKPLREMLQLSSNTILDTVNGWKLILSTCARLPEFWCDVTGYNMWSPHIYPNATQPNGMPWTVVPMNCTQGCLFNVFQDPREQHELSDVLPEVKARLHDALMTANRATIETPQVPDAKQCCVAAARYGGVLGPFLPPDGAVV